MHQADDSKKNPESKYDALIYKQNCVNDTVSAQVGSVDGKVFVCENIDFLFSYRNGSSTRRRISWRFWHIHSSRSRCAEKVNTNETIGSQFVASDFMRHDFADCQLNSKDLILQYDCMSKVRANSLLPCGYFIYWYLVSQIQNEILKEIKRFERLQIDLKSNLDRLQYKIDHESKVSSLMIQSSFLLRFRLLMYGFVFL